MKNLGGEREVETEFVGLSTWVVKNVAELGNVMRRSDQQGPSENRVQTEIKQFNDA